jgi:serine/threonine protein kinase
MTLTSGTKLGPYEVVSQLGAGGMGEVYRARDTRLDRTVAIKILPEHLSNNPDAKQRFDREARAISSLNHPNICTLYDVGHQDGMDYLVMEFLDGQTLADRLMKGPLPLEQALKYGIEICEGLEKAHRGGVTHRDLKPGNVMLTKTAAKLMDFGLAKAASASRPLASSLTMTISEPSTEKPLTAQGMIIGTFQYMSPEQVEGKEADARSDIFALGAVLYEMATGKRAFTGKTQASIVAAILASEPPPITQLQPMTPPALARVVKKCLAKDPDDRWQSARDLRTNLEWIEEGEGPATSSAVNHNPWPERAAWMLALVVLCALAFFVPVHYRAPSASEPVRFSVGSPEKTVFSGPPNLTVPVPQFALSPDGRAMAFVANSSGADPVIWMRSIDQVTARPLPGTDHAQSPFWSPDSRWLGFFAEGKLKKTPVAGGPVQVLADVADAFGGSWGTDGSIIFGKLSSAIFRVSSGGGVVTAVTKTDTVMRAHRWPQFLPDGRHFLFHVQGGDQHGVYVGSLDGGTQKSLVRSESSAIYAWPGYVLYVEGDTLLGQAFDAAHLELRGEPFTVAEHVGRSTGFNIGASASDTGILAYAAAMLHRGRLTWFDRAGNALNSVGVEGDYSDFRLSPNGQTLAVSLVDPKAWNPDIWLIDLMRGGPSRFTVGSALSAAPVWSPDGARIVFRTNRNGQTELYAKSAGGGGNEEVVLTYETQHAAGIDTPNLVCSDWSPDGRYVISSVPQQTTGDDLWLIPMVGDKKPFKFLGPPADQIHANFSPDGRFVAYTSNESGRFQVYVQTFPLSDRKWQVSTDGGYEPRWRGDGREIYYLSEDRKLMAVSVGAGPSFAVPKVLFQTRAPEGVTSRRTHYVPSRDGERFLVNTQSSDALPNPITVVLNWQADLKK